MYERNKATIVSIHKYTQSMLFIVCMEDPYKGLTYHTYIHMRLFMCRLYERISYIWGF